MHLGVITLCIVFPFDFVCSYKIRDFWFPPWCLLTIFRTSQHQKEVVALKSQLKSYKRRLKVKASTLSEFKRLCSLLYRIAFTPARKQYRIWLLFTHKNGDFHDAIRGNGAKLRGADLSLKWSVTFRIGVHTICFSCRNEKLSRQGCALVGPGGPWRLTFAPGRLEDLRFFIQIICWAPWILQVQRTGLPSIFLRAHPCIRYSLNKGQVSEML